MNVPVDNHEDRCQYADGCNKILFTYCPHCRLFLCINHLNEHYDLMRSHIEESINDGEQQKCLLEELMSKLNEQKVLIDRFYESQRQNLTDLYTFVNSLCEKKSDLSNNYELLTDYSKHAEQLNELKQLKIPSIQSWMFEIDQILEEKTNSQFPDFEIDQSECSDVIPTCDDDIIIDDNLDTDSQLANSYSDSFSNHSIEKVEHNSVCSTPSEFHCPLLISNIFGLTVGQHIPGVPCHFFSNESPLTLNRCYRHLTTYHNLKRKVARIISDEYFSPKNKNEDLTKIFLLSELRLSSVLSQSTAHFVSLCPLRKENIYGLQFVKQDKLCSNQSPLYLQQHLCHSHHFKASCARRLIRALINKQPLSEGILSDNECVMER